jgi:hypothetical protein
MPHRRIAVGHGTSRRASFIFISVDSAFRLKTQQSAVSAPQQQEQQEQQCSRQHPPKQDLAMHAMRS